MTTFVNLVLPLINSTIALIEEACCNVTGIPWFHKLLNQPTTDYIELRVCCDQELDDEDVAVGFYEFYVK